MADLPPERPERRERVEARYQELQQEVEGLRELRQIAGKAQASRLSAPLRILRFHADDLNLKPSWTGYNRWGKGPKQRLRFSKTGDPKLEEACATHLVRAEKKPLPIDESANTPPSQPAMDSASADR